MTIHFPIQPGGAGDELGPLLGSVIDSIRRADTPADTLAHVLDRALRLPADVPVPLTYHGQQKAGLRHWRLPAGAAGIVLAVGVAALGYRLGWFESPPAQPTLTNVPWTRPSVRPMTSAGGPASAPSTVPAPTPRPSMAGASPTRTLAVAAGTTVLASTGGDAPIKLGDRQPWTRDARVHLWDWSKGDASRPLAVTAAGGLALSPDGAWLVTLDGQVVDTATGKADRPAWFPRGARRAAFSPDGRTLLLLGSADPAAGVAGGATATLHDFPAGTKRAEILNVFVHMFAAAFTADGGQVVLMDSALALRRWDARTGRELARYAPAFGNSIRAIALSPDGKLLAAAGPPGDVRLWDTDTGRLLHKLPATLANETDPTEVRTLAFSPDGRRLAGGGGFRTHLWTTADGRPATALPRHESGGAAAVRFSADGQTITTVSDFVGTADAAGNDLLVYPQVRRWDVRTGQAAK